MGFFSAFQQFHSAGERPGEDFAGRYGEPAYCLYTATHLMSIHQQTDITGEDGSLRYQARTKLFSLHGKTDITDANGAFAAHIERKLFSLHERHFVTLADGTSFSLSNELFHLIRDVTNIEGLGWVLEGNLLELNFVLLDENRAPIAAIGQKLISLHNRYSIDIYQPQHEQAAVAILIALQKMLIARNRRRSSYNSSGS